MGACLIATVEGDILIMVGLSVKMIDCVDDEGLILGFKGVFISLVWATKHFSEIGVLTILVYLLYIHIMDRQYQVV